MLCEVMGRSASRRMVFNCSAPDTGNMEILAEHGTTSSRSAGSSRCWRARSARCFSMTEPRHRGLGSDAARTRARSSTATSG